MNIKCSAHFHNKDDYFVWLLTEHLCYSWHCTDTRSEKRQYWREKLGPVQKDKNLKMVVCDQSWVSLTGHLQATSPVSASDTVIPSNSSIWWGDSFENRNSFIFIHELKCHEIGCTITNYTIPSSSSICWGFDLHLDFNFTICWKQDYNSSIWWGDSFANRKQ